MLKLYELRHIGADVSQFIHLLYPVSKAVQHAGPTNLLNQSQHHISPKTILTIISRTTPRLLLSDSRSHPFRQIFFLESATGSERSSPVKTLLKSTNGPFSSLSTLNKTWLGEREGGVVKSAQEMLSYSRTNCELINYQHCFGTVPFIQLYEIRMTRTYRTFMVGLRIKCEDTLLLRREPG